MRIVIGKFGGEILNRVHFFADVAKVWILGEENSRWQLMTNTSGLPVSWR